MTDAELRDTFGMTAFGDRKRFRAAVAALADSSSDPLAGATVAGTEPASRGDALVGATRAGTVNVGPVPQRLGSYRVIGVVGAGGMGTVVRARHAEEGWASRQGGDVAIKLVHAHLASDATFRERFFAEADLGRRMQHASLVPTWDVVTEGAWLGTVMSFVEGEPLTSRVRAGGLAVEEVVRLLGPVGEALDHLHAHGVVHRDVKPANVVVRPDGRPVLLDLGIAKDTGSGEGHTRTMTTMGTSLWMAPEQADAKHVDGAADRYALGLMAYVLLSGRMPWEHGTSEARVLVAKMTGQLVPVGEARPGLPAHVADAVTRMVALAPGDRFASCGQFITALQYEAPSSAQRLEDASGIQSVLAQRKPDSLLGSVAKSGVAVEWFG
jgi:serine/threonine protein kinase